MPWIGAEYEVLPNGVRVRVSAERIRKLTAKVTEALAAKGMVKGMRSLTGELSWVAGIVPTLRPFVHIEGRGAARQRPNDMVFVKQVQRPLTWILRFLEGHHGGLQRQRFCEDQWSQPQWLVTRLVRTDASTTGAGAALFDANRNPVRWWSVGFDAALLQPLGLVAGEPGLMTAYEVLALLIAAFTWAPLLRGCRLGIVAQLDSESALGVAVKLASPHPLVNQLAAELALQLEVLGADALSAEHYRNLLNIEADALTRLREGKQVPGRLAGLPRDAIPAPLPYLRLLGDTAPRLHSDSKTPLRKARPRARVNGLKGHKP